MSLRSERLIWVGRMRYRQIVDEDVRWMNARRRQRSECSHCGVRRDDGLIGSRCLWRDGTTWPVTKLGCSTRVVERVMLLEFSFFRML